MSKVKSFFARKYGNGAGRCEGSGFRNGSSASSVTTHGEMLVQKFFAKNGPSGWYSQAWMSRALQSFIKTKPKMWSIARSIDTGWPNELPGPIKNAISSSKSKLLVGPNTGAGASGG